MTHTGIDVDIDVEHGGKRSKIATPQNGSEARNSQPNSASFTSNPQNSDSRPADGCDTMETDSIAKRMKDVSLNPSIQNENVSAASLYFKWECYLHLM